MRRGAQALVVLLGLWLALSPMIGPYARHAHAIQDSIVGILVVLAGLASMFTGLSASAAPMWLAFVLGVWTAFTPMMYGQAGQSFSAYNDMFVGLGIVIAAGIAEVSRLRVLLRAGPSDPDGATGQMSP